MVAEGKDMSCNCLTQIQLYDETQAQINQAGFHFNLLSVAPDKMALNLKTEKGQLCTSLFRTTCHQLNDSNSFVDDNFYFMTH